MHLTSLLTPLLLSLPLTLSAPATTTTCPTSNIILDGGFESGVTPPTSGGNSWTVIDFIGASSYSLTSPGSSQPGGGKYAFTASLNPGPYSSGQSGDTLTQTMHTCAGHNYSISVDFKFGATVQNECAVSVQYPFKTGTGSVTTGSGSGGIVAGVWYTTGATFQAVAGTDVLSIVFSCGGSVNNLISVDNVKVAPYAGNAF